MAAAAFLIALVVYAAFLTKAYDLNIVPWVTRVKAPNFSDPVFFFPQHLLHLAAESGIYQIWTTFGYSQGPILPMQVASAIAGAAAAALLFSLVARITRDVAVAALATALWGFSYQSWTLQTDAWYYPLGSVFVVLTAWLLLKDWPTVEAVPSSTSTGSSGSTLALAGIAFGLAVLASLSTLMYLPGMLLAVALEPSHATNRSRLRTAFLFLSVFAVLTVFVYVLVGVGPLGRRDSGSLLSWLFGTYPRLPRWGQFSWSRVVEAGPYAAAAFLPLNSGIGIRSLLAGNVDPSRLVPQFSALGFAISLLGLALLAIRRRKETWSRHARTLVVCLAWLVPVSAFWIWVEPQALWASLPVFSLSILAAVVLAEARRDLSPRRRQLAMAAGVLSILLLALGNFVASVYPNHKSFPVTYQKAAQAASLMAPQDIVITLTWDWTGYLPLFDRSALSLLMQSRGKMTGEEIRALIKSTVRQAQQNSARVFIVNAGAYPASEWHWLTQELGLAFDKTDFDDLSKRVGWTFSDGEIVWELLGRQ